MRLWITFLVVGSFLMPLGMATPAGASGAPAQLPIPGAVVVTSQQTPYGTVLFTGDGRALYMFTFDMFGSAGTPAQSECTGRCAAAWPPLLVPGPFGPVQAAGGVQQSALGTIQRPDGTYQVTYFGYPLYMFVADKAAGQTNGEDVANFNGLWYLLTVDGKPTAGVATVSLESAAEGSVLSAPTAFSTYRSLYQLTTDPKNASTCFDGCARFWPPLLTTGTPTAGSGVDPNGLGTLRRPDGTLQVTYFGTPLYFFAFDLPAGAKSGLTNGEDVVDPTNQGVWYLLTPGGIAAPAPATVTTASSALGTVLAFKTFPLYAFSADTGTSSACTGLCARIWTPLLTTGSPLAAAGSGVDQAGLGTIPRSDGTLQVTYKGHPLYLFAKDFSGTGGQNITAFGGAFLLMQVSGTPSPAIPTKRTVVAIPQMTTFSSGASASFVVAFTSSTAGRGEVYFGSGPGCSGLVEVGTQDKGAGTTDHAVTVTGNDIPGTVGDNGILPGVTYSFEVVTVSASGQETDDNSGKCYTVTVPSS